MHLLLALALTPSLSLFAALNHTMQSRPSGPVILRAAFFLHKLEVGRFGASRPEHMITPNTSKGFASRKLSLDIFGEAFHYISAIVHAITPVALQCPVCQPEDSLGAGTQRPYISYNAANQAESKPLLAVARCKFMQIQHVAGKPKKKQVGGVGMSHKGTGKE